MYYISLAMLSVVSALHITSRPGGERRELQVAPGIPAQSVSHLPALLGDGAEPEE